MTEPAKFGYHSQSKRVPCGTACYLLDPDQTEIVLIYRIGAHGADTWSVPGGWQDPHEDPEESVKRECWEEVGVTVNSVDFLGYTYTLFKEGLENTTLWFASCDWSGRVRNTNPDRIFAVQTLPWKEVLEMPREHLFEGFISALEKGIIPDVFA